MATSTVASITRGFSNTYRTPFAYSVLACGHSAHGELPIGAEVECEYCDAQAAALQQVRAAIADGRVSHSRCRGGIYGESIHVYAHDATSPTGVRLLCSIEPGPEVDALLRGSLSPLSPTERR